METVTATIDGQRVVASQGTTILAAAQKIGIEIPTLCHREELKPSGNCRICVVEIEGMSRLVASCHTPIEAGMKISTHSHKVIQTRKVIIELMLAAHTGPCMSDMAARECGLHRIAADIEAGAPRFQMKKPRFYPIEMMSPYVRRDLSRCILCRNCIRACNEIAGHNVYAMAYRGFASKVVVDCDAPLNKDVCKDCGVCIESCPTSALMYPEGSKNASGCLCEPKDKGSWKESDLHPKQSELLNRLLKEKHLAGQITSAAMQTIAQELGISVGEVYGMATFYAFLTTQPQGKNVIRICKSLPCYIQHANDIIAAVQKSIGIVPGQISADGKFSFELANCIGACDQAPAMLINDTLFGNLNSEKIATILASY